MNDDEIQKILSCLNAKNKSHKKGDYIICHGENPTNIMILLSGKCNIQYDDYWGNRSILNVISPSEMFGEAYISPDSGVMMNDVYAVEDSEILLLNPNRLLTACAAPCEFHSRIIKNLLFAISEKNRKLVQKIGCISKRTTRDKLISFLSNESVKQNSNEIIIPFNRQQLADFLFVDRSAMSAELCKMRDEGLIEFKKNKFRLIRIG